MPCLRLYCVTAQFIKTQQLEEHDKIAKIDLGNARLVQSYKHLLHKINTNDLLENTENFEMTVNDLRHIEFSEEIIEVLKEKVDQLKIKIKALVPSRREKRGLVNGFGSLIKVVTGNMDAKDAQQINDKFNVVKENEDQITQKINQQSILNQEITLRFENITQHINQEQTTINNFIKNYNNNIYKTLNDEHNQIQLLQYITRINFNIDILQNHINSSAESILLTKLNIIPKFILSETEIESINKFISNQNIIAESEEHLYRLLTLETYIDKSYIIFHAKIPLFKTQIFQLAHVVPRPLHQTKFLITPNYILYNQNDQVMIRTSKKSVRKYIRPIYAKVLEHKPT
ncbi:probable kinetochore protein NDC80 [Drosophila mauritiana]|uniref:Probable kinetochore protein NDC80 n=1 Tax=Drosophila mauritiana TaxID=7226 RepID=A0A6P8JB09_DROMA|nr:probable kinetochore protein NDC80 [Drosophila mauritiana]